MMLSMLLIFPTFVQELLTMPKIAAYFSNDITVNRKKLIVKVGTWKSDTGYAATCLNGKLFLRFTCMRFLPLIFSSRRQTWFPDLYTNYRFSTYQLILSICPMYTRNNFFNTIERNKSFFGRYQVQLFISMVSFKWCPLTGSR